ncbi:hypothetical protein FB465_3918 [Kitasatospora atroaurantiaca]|uniref:Uncharacterized protein n=1 Tax=Kitasatospora atroaurantiaca TaxID=285545 RepID=A0A561ET75_9ACTN|nr:hypothetical protein FB465_3918 [Kitasatospora atroaurantiaca]
MRTRQIVLHARPQVELARTTVGRAGHSVAAAASIAFRMRFSETGVGVPSPWAKKLTRSSSIIQRI